MADFVLLVSSGLFYALSAALYLYRFYAEVPGLSSADESSKGTDWAMRALLVGFVIHIGYLVVSYFELGRFPVVGLSESLSFMSFLIVGGFIIAYRSYPLSSIGIFVTPLALIGMIASVTLSTGSGGQVNAPDLKTILFPVHITLAFIGHASFAIAAAVSIMYLIQERQLKQHKRGKLLNRLPSLGELDELSYRCLAVGFPALTLGIITGSLWLNNVKGLFFEWDPKITASLITWLLYSALLHARLVSGWRGRRAAQLAIVGFIGILFTFIVVGIFFTKTHRFF